jgi:microcystin-dependent protein
MKKVMCLVALMFIASICRADGRYDVSNSTKPTKVAHSETGSMRFQFASSTSSTPTVDISSSAVSFGGLKPENLAPGTTNAPYVVWVASALYAMNGGSGGAGALDSFPIGAIIAYSSTSTIPTDFYYCNGSTRSRTNDAALFAVIGTIFGPGDGSTTFNLPDGRGMVLRGLDNGRGLDSDPYRLIGSTQADSYASHTHTIPHSADGNSLSASAGTPYDIPWGEPGSGDAFTVPAAGGTETRMKNLAVAYIIKYRLSTSTTIAIYDTPGTWTKPQVHSSGTVYADGSTQTTAYSVLASSRVILTAGNFSTTAASFVNVDTNTATVTITTLGTTKVLIGATGTVSNSAATNVSCFDVAIDTNRQGGTNGLFWVASPGNSYGCSLSFTYMSGVLAAGSHTFKLQYYTSGGTATVQAGSAAPLTFWVQEIR